MATATNNTTMISDNELTALMSNPIERREPNTFVETAATKLPKAVKKGQGVPMPTTTQKNAADVMASDSITFLMS